MCVCVCLCASERDFAIIIFVLKIDFDEVCIWGKGCRGETRTAPLREAVAMEAMEAIFSVYLGIGTRSGISKYDILG